MQKITPPADNTFVPVYNEDPDVDVYLNTKALPRIQLIYTATSAPDNTTAFNLVHDPAFNPANQIVIEAPTNTAQFTNEAVVGSGANLFYTSYGAGQFSVVSQSSTAAYLVVAEVWYPGWTATINGRPTDIFRADSAFMSVVVPSGENTVVFSFTSPWLTVGAIITVATLIISLATMFVLSRNPNLSSNS